MHSRIREVEQATTFLLADHLKDSIEDDNPLVDDASPFSDCLDAAISEVDWRELAGAFVTHEWMNDGPSASRFGS